MYVGMGAVFISYYGQWVILVPVGQWPAVQDGQAVFFFFFFYYLSHCTILELYLHHNNIPEIA